MRFLIKATTGQHEGLYPSQQAAMADGYVRFPHCPCFVVTPLP